MSLLRGVPTLGVAKAKGMEGWNNIERRNDKGSIHELQVLSNYTVHAAAFHTSSSYFPESFNSFVLRVLTSTRLAGFILLSLRVFSSPVIVVLFLPRRFRAGWSFRVVVFGMRDEVPASSNSSSSSLAYSSAACKRAYFLCNWIISRSWTSNLLPMFLKMTQ